MLHVIKQLKKFNYKEKEKFFQELMSPEGDFSIQDVLDVEHQLCSLRTILNRNMSWVPAKSHELPGRNDDTEKLISIYGSLEHTQKENDHRLSAQFTQLPINERMLKAKEYLNEISQGSPKRLVVTQQHAKDMRIWAAVKLLVKLYISHIYDLNISTAEQQKQVTYLIPTQHTAATSVLKKEGTSPESRSICAEFQKLCSALMPTSMSKDKKDYVNRLIIETVREQQQLAVPVHRRLEYLTELSTAVFNSRWNNLGWRWKFWEGKTPDGISRLRDQLKNLPREEELLKDASKVDVVIKLYQDVKTLLSQKVGNRHIMAKDSVAKLYQDYNETADTINRFER